MLACGHDSKPFGTPICEHLRTCRTPWLSYLKWYTGSGMDAVLLCTSCASERESGWPVATAFVCQACFDYATDEIGDFVGIRGQPEIRIRSDNINAQFTSTLIPKTAGRVIDIAPINAAGRSLWLLLADDGSLTEFDADAGDYRSLASTTLVAEPQHKPWRGHVLRHRLFVSAGGEYAAVVNDFGHHGQVIDLRSGQPTMQVDGGSYHAETVPLSFAFAEISGRTIAIHRTAWNRLDISDPATGALLTERNPTSYQRGEARPAHYLDYFHGALYVSPDSRRIADDGWVWHPVGMPTVWSVSDWLNGNEWESEDGPTKKHVCYRDYYWNHGLCWIDNDHLAIGGIGNDDNEMVDGVRIFQLEPRPPIEVVSFVGPAGQFFSDGQLLFSSDASGLSRWDLSDGCRTGFLPEFRPGYHHRGARELVQLRENYLIRWQISSKTNRGGT